MAFFGLMNLASTEDTSKVEIGSKFKFSLETERLLFNIAYENKEVIRPQHTFSKSTLPKELVLEKLEISIPEYNIHTLDKTYIIEIGVIISNEQPPVNLIISEVRFLDKPISKTVDKKKEFNVFVNLRFVYSRITPNLITI